MRIVRHARCITHRGGHVRWRDHARPLQKMHTQHGIRVTHDVSRIVVVMFVVLLMRVPLIRSCKQTEDRIINHLSYAKRTVHLQLATAY